MGWLDIAGGAARGVTMGLQDQEAYQRWKQEKEMRDLALARQREDNALMETLKGVRPAGTTPGLVDTTGDAAGEAAARPVVRTEADQARDIAAAYQKHGKGAESLQASATARTLDREAREDENTKRRDAVVAKYRPMFEKLRGGKPDDIQSVFDAAVDKYNAEIPDGHTAYKARTPEGIKISVINDKTGKVVKSHVITTENARETAAAALQLGMLHEIGAVSTADFLKSIDKGIDLSKLGIEQKKLGLDERKVGQKDAEIELEGRKVASMEELNTAHAGYYRKLGQEVAARSGFTQVLGQTDDAIYGLDRKGDLKTIPLPRGSDGKPLQLFPKLTGQKASVVKFEKNDDGSRTAVDQLGRPLFNLWNGVELPLSVSVTDFQALQKEAADKGVRLSSGRDANDRVVLAYIGKDEQPYDTLSEAVKAKPAKKGVKRGTPATAPDVEEGSGGYQLGARAREKIDTMKEGISNVIGVLDTPGRILRNELDRGTQQFMYGVTRTKKR